jgi:uncharacterized membrane protein
MDMTPAIAIHLAAALAAVALGPIALWARRAGAHRPKLHRAAGYAWVTLMTVTAVSALFIRSGALPNIAGYSPIHLLVPVVIAGLAGAFVALARGNITAHRMTMQGLYFGACLVAGFFTLLPNRILGQALGVQSMAQLVALLAAAAVAYLSWRLVRGRFARKPAGALALQRDPW